MGVVLDKVRTRSYAELTSQIDAIEKIGKWIARSQMFGCKTEEQGHIIAMDCFVTGMPLLEYQRRNMLVAGRPSDPYDAMLAEFRERGGKHKILSYTPELASVELSKDGETRTFSLSWEEFQQEPVPYLGKEDEIVAALSRGEKPPLKPKYATPRSRANMLFARLVSDAIRKMSPEVNFGSYTPEEISDIPGSTSAPAPAPATSASVVAEPVQEPAPEPAAAEIEPKPAGLTSTEGRTEMSVSEPLTEDQYAAIIESMKVLRQGPIPDIVQRIKAKLDKSGISELRGLTVAEGDVLLAALQRKEIDAWAEAALKGHTAGK